MSVEGSAHPPPAFSSAVEIHRSLAASSSLPILLPMKARILPFLFVVLLVTAGVHSGPVAADGFVTLFNGKNLDGWTTRQPDNKDWKAVDGVIDCDPQGDASGDRNLWTTKEYG